MNVIDVLINLCTPRRLPGSILSENGPKLVAQAVLVSIADRRLSDSLQRTRIHHPRDIAMQCRARPCVEQDQWKLQLPELGRTPQRSDFHCAA